MEEIRDAIEEHRFAEYKAAKLAGMEGLSLIHIFPITSSYTGNVHNPKIQYISMKTRGSTAAIYI